MACDLSTQRRRVKWEYLQSQNSPCTAQMGFANDGSLAKDFWLIGDNPQTDARWLWLDDGVLLEFDEGELPRIAWTWLGSQPIRRAQFTIDGVNIIQGCPEDGLPSTMLTTMELQILDEFGPSITDEEESIQCRLHPPNNIEWLLIRFHTVLPNNVDTSNIVMPLTMTPLKACHNCTSGA